MTKETVKKEVNLLKKPMPATIKLADGNEYGIPPIDLETLSNMEETMGFGLGQLQSKLTEKAAGTMKLAIYALLKEKSPDLKLEGFGRLITFDVMKDVADVFSRIIAMAG